MFVRMHVCLWTSVIHIFVHHKIYQIQFELSKEKIEVLQPFFMLANTCQWTVAVFLNLLHKLVR